MDGIVGVLNIDLLRGVGLFWVGGVVEVDLFCWVGGVMEVGFVVWLFGNMFEVGLEFIEVLGVLIVEVVLNLLLNRLILELNLLLFVEVVFSVWFFDVVLEFVFELVGVNVVEFGVKGLDWFVFGVVNIVGLVDMFVELGFWFVFFGLVFLDG